MGLALEVVAGQATAPGATVTALAMNTGNNAQVRLVQPGSEVRLINTWAFVQAGGFWRIRSPNLHDNVQGLRFQNEVLTPRPKWQFGTWQKLIPQDTLTLEITGSAGGGDIETAAMLHYYSDLPGIAARLFHPARIYQNIVNQLAQPVAIAPGVAGNYSGQVAINSLVDNLKANTDYAVLGYTINQQVNVVRLVSTDFGNLGIGGPGSVADNETTQNWFLEMSARLGLPLVPVFNAANKTATLVDVHSNENATALVVTLNLAQLAPGLGNPGS
jgi:hypothetical protein